MSMNSGHILAILIGFYASFAVTAMSVAPLLGWITLTNDPSTGERDSEYSDNLV